MKTRTFPKLPLAALFKYAFSLCINIRWQRRQLTPSGTLVLLILVATSLCLQTKPSSAAPSGNDSVRFSNFTSLSDQELNEVLASTLKPELREIIARNKLVVFALTAAFDGRKACFGSVGLTEAAPPGRHPRYPARMRSAYMKVGSKDEWNASACESSQLLVAATEAFSKAPVEDLLDHIESTKSLGKIAENRPPNPKLAAIFTIGGINKDSLLEIIHKYHFGKAFDYRQVEVFVASQAIQFDHGNIMCVAFAGITSSSPDNRNSRWPGSTNGFVRLQNGGDASGCKQLVAEQAIDELLKSPWTPQGLLNNFSATKEDGIALPDPVKVAKAKALIDKSPKPVTVSATTRSTNHVSCTNNCSNGNCVRRFPDGSTERWQAPRKFNPFNGNWEWDTTTNACGL